MNKMTEFYKGTIVRIISKRTKHFEEFATIEAISSNNTGILFKVIFIKGVDKRVHTFTADEVEILRPQPIVAIA